MANSSFGSGWPNCSFPRSVIVVGGYKVVVHAELAELFGFMCIFTEKMGYKLNPRGFQECWGYACRPVAGTKSASNHSWGTALDINATHNYRPIRGDIPEAVGAMWESHGFTWGVRWAYRDAMHFEYKGSVVSARQEVANIKKFLGTPPTPVPPAPKPPVPVEGKATGWMNLAHPLTKEGDKNGTVGHLQVLLGGLVVDNDFGPATKARLIARQRSLGIAADGIAGDQTWGNIHPLVREGDTGTYVVELQNSLQGLGADGIFGSHTKAVVTAYQRNKGLDADGIAGKWTWETLCRDGG